MEGLQVKTIESYPVPSILLGDLIILNNSFLALLRGQSLWINLPRVAHLVDNT